MNARRTFLFVFLTVQYVLVPCVHFVIRTGYWTPGIYCTNKGIPSSPSKWRMIPSTVWRYGTEIYKIAAGNQCCGDGFYLYEFNCVSGSEFGIQIWNFGSRTRSIWSMKLYLLKRKLLWNWKVFFFEVQAEIFVIFNLYFEHFFDNQEWVRMLISIQQRA